MAYESDDKGYTEAQLGYEADEGDPEEEGGEEGERARAQNVQR